MVHESKHRDKSNSYQNPSIKTEKFTLYDTKFHKFNDFNNSLTALLNTQPKFPPKRHKKSSERRRNSLGKIAELPQDADEAGHGDALQNRLGVIPIRGTVQLRVGQAELAPNLVPADGHCAPPPLSKAPPTTNPINHPPPFSHPYHKSYHLLLPTIGAERTIKTKFYLCGKDGNFGGGGIGGKVGGEMGRRCWWGRKTKMEWERRFGK